MLTEQKPRLLQDAIYNLALILKPQPEYFASIKVVGNLEKIKLE